MQDDLYGIRTVGQARARAGAGEMAGVYGWMSLGLLVSLAGSVLALSVPGVAQLVFGNRIVFFALLFGELALVWFLGARIMTMSTGMAKGGFLFYALLNGVTLSVIFLAYTASSIAQVFFVTAGMFGATSAYGYLTKRDLTGFGSFLFMGLVGIVIASLVNLFTKSEMVDWVVSCVGVFVFAGLAAYDTQKIRTILAEVEAERRGNAAVLGALALYLDFINLFLMLLRLFGDRRR